MAVAGSTAGFYASGRQTAVAAALLLPAALLYTRAGSEILIGLIDGLFLVRSCLRRRWSWLGDRWVGAAGLWWAWLILCSTPLPLLALGSGGSASWMQALLAGRFFLLAAALSSWVLREERIRRVLLGVMAVCAGWIMLECWQQYVSGRNVAGWPRWIDGALTGPFREPRAGPALVLLLFPVLLPITSHLVNGSTRLARLAGALMFALAIATMVLIGQRMPALLTGLGLLACGVVVPRLRVVVLAAASGAALLVTALPIVSEPTFQKLVVHFADQMRHFSQSSYGQLYVRATAIGLAHPIVGLGFDGFRHACAQPEYQHGIRWLGMIDAAGPSGCNIHPHNHYLEALTSGGLPGMVLFSLLVVLWLIALGRGMVVHPTPERVGCFIGVLLGVWPLASTSAFFTLPNAGWLFVVLGMGLAARPRVGVERTEAALIPAMGAAWPGRVRQDPYPT